MIIRTVAAALALSLSMGGAALAFPGGGSDNGDAYLNDAQKNPRFIEPNGDFAPGRYRESNPQYGYGDRQRAAAYGPYGRGRIDVRPYSDYRP